MKTGGEKRFGARPRQRLRDVYVRLLKLPLVREPRNSN